MSAPADGRFIHLADLAQRPGVLTVWERHRHRSAHWLVECFAEMMGVFFYCYAGIGSTAAFVIGTLAKEEGVSSIQQIGWAYAGGIVLALTVCSATSGGHINPCMTLTFAVSGQFPWSKVPRYIIAQILGAYIACMLIYAQYKTSIGLIEEALIAQGVFDKVNFTAQGPAGIFGLYAPVGVGLGRVFLNEFVTDFFLGLSIFACLDPTNFLAPPMAAPWIIGFAYAIAIWGYAPNGLAANAARDVGGRLAVLTIWGSKASGGAYAAIAALTNIPATMLARVAYEFMFTDSSRVISPGARDHLEAHKAHLDRRAGGYKGPVNAAPSTSTDNKSDIHTYEHAGQA